MSRVVTSVIALLFLAICVVFCVDAMLGSAIVSSTIGAEFLDDMIGMKIVAASALVGIALTAVSLSSRGPGWVMIADIVLLVLFVAAVTFTYLAVTGIFLPFAKV